MSGTVMAAWKPENLEAAVRLLGEYAHGTDVSSRTTIPIGLLES